MKQELKQEQEVAELGIGDILGGAFTIGVTVIGVAYMLEVAGDVRDDMTASSAEQNATIEGITALSKIPEKLGTIVTIFMAAVLIGLLVRYLWIRGSM